MKLRYTDYGPICADKYDPDATEDLARIIYGDPEYQHLMRLRRFLNRLSRMQREEDNRIRADRPLFHFIRKRHLDLFAYLRAVYPTFGDPGADIHERIFRDALKRAEADDSQKRRFRKVL